MKNEEMALLFSEATPYIQKYHGKTMVIKYGGNAMINETLKNAVMNDLVTLTCWACGWFWYTAAALPSMRCSKKWASRATLRAACASPTTHHGDRPAGAAGKVNKDLVAKLRGRGVGLCGMDGQMLRCTELDPQLGHVGEIVTWTRR